MTTPFSTPRYPGAPHPTPRSAGPSTTRIPRAPIHNPYDKFTQPEFDAWIGDITGALKRALGYEDATVSTATEVERVGEPQEDDGEEEYMEDSFAEVKARRLAKGKERAREEDFELEDQEYYDEAAWSGEEDAESGGSVSSEESAGDASPKRTAEVIDLLSDDDEGDVPDHQEDEGANEDEAVPGPVPVYVDDDVSDDDGEELQNSDASSNEAPLQSLYDEVARPLYDEEDDAESAGTDSEDELEQQPRSSPVHVDHDITEVLDSDDEPEQDQLQSSDRVAIPPRFLRKPGINFAHAEHDDEAHEADGEADGSDAEVDTAGVHDNVYYDIDEDEEDGEWFCIILKCQCLKCVELTAEEEPTNPPDIRDPWEGPRTFAEDFFAGGDAIPSSSAVSASLITPLDVDDTEEPPHPAEVLDVDILYADAVKPSLDVAEFEGTPITPMFKDTQENAEGENSPPASTETFCREGVDANVIETENEPEHSLPSPSLSKGIDWNWPPAFPGRVATASGHLVDCVNEDSEEIDAQHTEEISHPALPYTPASAEIMSPEHRPAAVQDPVEVRVESSASTHVAPTTPDASAVAAVDLYGEFDALYDMGSAGVFEPVSPGGMDFGDLPPTPHDIDRKFSGLQVPLAASQFVEAVTNADVDSKTPEDSEVVPQSVVDEMFDAAVEMGSAASEAGDREVELEEKVIQEVQVTSIVGEEEDEPERHTPQLNDDIDVVSVTTGEVGSPATDSYVVQEITTEEKEVEVRSIICYVAVQ